MKYVPTAKEELYGTWTNENNFPYKKTIVSPNGQQDFSIGVKLFNNIADTTTTVESVSQITSKWKDADENIWYKCDCKDIHSPHKWQTLEKLSKSATVHEIMTRFVGADFSSDAYPTTIDPTSTDYLIEYRAGN